MDFWADTAQLNDVYYQHRRRPRDRWFRVPRPHPVPQRAGTIATMWDALQTRPLQPWWSTWPVRGGQYHLGCGIITPTARLLLMMTGNGVRRVNNHIFRPQTSLSLNLPTPAEYPPMAHYVFPTVDRASWTRGLALRVIAVASLLQWGGLPPATTP